MATGALRAVVVTDLSAMKTRTARMERPVSLRVVVRLRLSEVQEVYVSRQRSVPMELRQVGCSEAEKGGWTRQIRLLYVSMRSVVKVEGMLVRGIELSCLS